MVCQFIAPWRFWLSMAGKVWTKATNTSVTAKSDFGDDDDDDEDEDEDDGYGVVMEVILKTQNKKMFTLLP